MTVYIIYLIALFFLILFNITASRENRLLSYKALMFSLIISLVLFLGEYFLGFSKYFVNFRILIIFTLVYFAINYIIFKYLIINNRSYFHQYEFISLIYFMIPFLVLSYVIGDSSILINYFPLLFIISFKTALIKSDELNRLFNFVLLLITIMLYITYINSDNNLVKYLLFIYLLIYYLRGFFEYDRYFIYENLIEKDINNFFYKEDVKESKKISKKNKRESDIENFL